MRYLALDLGARRIGIAVGDDAAGIATPLRTLARRGGEADLRALAEVARREGADALVVGLPLTLRGEEGAEARRARELGGRIGERLGLPVEFVDERLTTREAARYRTGRAFDVDAAAAAVLLQHHLARRKPR